MNALVLHLFLVRLESGNRPMPLRALVARSLFGVRYTQFVV